MCKEKRRRATGLAGVYISEMGKTDASQTPPAPAKKVVKLTSKHSRRRSQTNYQGWHINHHLQWHEGTRGDCLAKTQKQIAINEEDEEEHLIVADNYRARLDPPIPETYFVNCLIICFITTKNSELVGGEAEGFVKAVELFGELIHEKLNGWNPERCRDVV